MVVLDVQIPVLKGQQVTIHAHTGGWLAVGGWVVHCTACWAILLSQERQAS